MITTAQAPGRTRRIRIRKVRVVALVLVLAAAIGLAVDHRWPASTSSPPPSLTAPPSSAAPPLAPRASEHRPPALDQHSGQLGEADGAVPEGATAFDDIPGVAKLDPALLGPLRRASTDARDAGVTLVVDSGWRSAEYQQRLLSDAIAKYGSQQEASRWVATPETSSHVAGKAVDIGPPQAAAWLSEHGAQYGLCRIYGNEPWHFEPRPDAVDRGCPPLYTDPTHDPRMQR